VSAGTQPEGHWLSGLQRHLATTAPAATAFVLPAYRPDLVLAAAEMLGFVHVDFRKDYMRDGGGDPALQPLDLIERAIGDHAGAAGLVLQNVEALLATRSATVRQVWLARFLGSPRPFPVLLPVVLFAADLPRTASVVTIDAEAIPPDSLLMRLWAQR